MKNKNNTKTNSGKTPPLYRETEERGLGGELKVALYIRVSTERQAKEGDSLEDQETELRKFCDYRNYAIYRCYVERGKSGGNTNRPEYQKLVKDIEKGSIQAVIVKKLDRLSRSLLDFENLMKLMQEKGVEFISLKENFDTTTAMGKAMLRVALVFAQLEREQTAERILDVMTFRATKGLYNGGQTPFGYTNVNKELIPYNKERKILELMFSKFLETKSVTAVARYLNETGYRDRKQQLFDHRQVEKMLRNPTYVGKVRWKGQTYQGIHRPIISEDQYHQVQDLFKQRRFISRKSKTNALLQRILICGTCKHPMTTSYCFNHKRKKYYYYRCSSTCSGEKHKHNKCQVKYIPFTKIESRVIEILMSLSEEAPFKRIENRILSYNEQIESREQHIQKDIEQLEQSLLRVRQKKDKYLDSLISNQFLSEEREQISGHINDLEMDEKQLKGGIQKQQFELMQTKDEKIDLADLKKRLITFRVEHPTYSNKQLRIELISFIEEIFCYPEHLSIRFRIFPWEEEFSL